MDTLRCLTPHLYLTPQPNALDLHRGWCAARARLPDDAGEAPAWRTGWALWHATHLDSGHQGWPVSALLQVAHGRPMPRAWPDFSTTPPGAA